MEWREYKIGEISEIKGGKRLPSDHELVAEVTAHPYIKARDIGDGVINSKNLEYLTEETFKFIKRYIVSEGDICITIVGANIGDIGLVNSNLDKANLTENAVRL